MYFPAWGRRHQRVEGVARLQRAHPPPGPGPQSDDPIVAGSCQWIGVGKLDRFSTRTAVGCP